MFVFERSFWNACTRPLEDGVKREQEGHTGSGACPEKPFLIACTRPLGDGAPRPKNMNKM